MLLDVCKEVQFRGGPEKGLLALSGRVGSMTVNASCQTSPRGGLPVSSPFQFSVDATPVIPFPFLLSFPCTSPRCWNLCTALKVLGYSTHLYLLAKCRAYCSFPFMVGVWRFHRLASAQLGTKCVSACVCFPKVFCVEASCSYFAVQCVNIHLLWRGFNGTMGCHPAFTWTLLFRIEEEEQLNLNKKWSYICLIRNTIFWLE